jgi:hypothetical protein
MILTIKSPPRTDNQHQPIHANTTFTILLLLHFLLVEITAVSFQRNMIRPRIVHTPIRHFVRHMRKQRPHQCPKHNINRMVPRISDLAERKQDGDTPRRHKQHKFPMMHPLHPISPLTPLPRLPSIVVSKVPTPGQDLEFRIQIQRQEPEARERRARMPARKGHLRFPDFIRVAPADLAGRVEVQVAVSQR